MAMRRASVRRRQPAAAAAGSRPRPLCVSHMYKLFCCLPDAGGSQSSSPPHAGKGFDLASIFRRAVASADSGASGSSGAAAAEEGDAGLAAAVAAQAVQAAVASANGEAAPAGSSCHVLITGGMGALGTLVTLWLAQGAAARQRSAISMS